MREDYKDLIQEWFANCLSAEDVTELYADLLHEIKVQMGYCLSSYERKE